MKRSFAAVVVLLLVVVGGIKIALMIGASQLLSHIKTELVSVGALNYKSVSTSLADSEIVVGNPTFKHFVLKKDFAAEQVHLKFDGLLDMLVGVFSGLNSDYSALDRVVFDGLETSLPDAELYALLSEDMEPELGLWFAFLSCDGALSPTKNSLAMAGIENPVADAELRLRAASSTLEFDVPGIGRILIELDLLARLSGTGAGRVQSVSYIENGFFKRLAQTCPTEATADNGDNESHGSLAPLSEKVIDGWSRNLAARGYRINPEALNLIGRYIKQGGVLRFEAGDPIPAPAEDAFGWQDAKFVSRVQVSANDGAMIPLDLEYYIAPPVVEVEPEQVLEVEPAYVEMDLSEAGTLVAKQVRLSMLKGQQHEGVVKLVDEHQIEIVPLQGDGSVSFTFKLSELASVEVWVE